MLNFTFTLPGRPLWAGPYPNWGFLQITLFNICGMESSMNLYLSSEAFWNAHLHKVAEHSATVRPVQHVDVVGATFKFVKINSKKS